MHKDETNKHLILQELIFSFKEFLMYKFYLVKWNKQVKKKDRKWK